MNFRWMVAAALFLAVNSGCFAETRLLSGDAGNKAHGGGGVVMDISPDGDLILFYGRKKDGAGPGGLQDTGLYLRRLSTGTLEYVSDPAWPLEGITGAGMSDDGRHITWAVEDDREIYWRDREAGITRWITQGQRTGGEPFEVISAHPVISADGRFVAFASNSLLLESNANRLPAPRYPGVHLYDSSNGSIRVVSLSAGGMRITSLGSIQANTLENYGNFDMTPDARYIVFATDSPDSHPDRKNVMFGGNVAVLRRDIQNGQTILLNRNSTGTVCNGSFHYPRISANGNRVVFRGQGVGVPFGSFPQTKMVSTLPGNPGNDLYVKEVSTGTVWALTRTVSGLPHSGALGTQAGISDDGGVVAFSSSAPDLIAGGSGTDPDAFRTELGAGGSVTRTQVSVSPTDAGNVSVTAGPRIAGDGAYISFVTIQFERMGFPGSSAFPHSVGVGGFPPLVTPAGAYETWAAVLPEGKRGPNDNPSGDGVPNLLKFFIGSDANVPDLRFLPYQEIKPGAELEAFPPDADYQTLVVRIRRSLPREAWRVESAGDLERLVDTPGPTLQVGDAVSDDEFDVYRFRSFTPMGDQGYMRLKVLLVE